MKEADQVPRAAARRPLRRTRQRRPRRPARPDGRPHLADGLRGHDRDDGERLHQHQEPVAHHHRRREIPKGGANGVILAQAGRFGGWSLYLKDGKPMYTYNFLGLSAIQGRRDPSRCPQARRPSATSSPTTAAAWARAARARSSSTARRSPKAGSNARSAASSRPMKARTSASTTARR